MENAQAELERLRRENAELRQRLDLATAVQSPVVFPVSIELPLIDSTAPSVDGSSSVQDKIAIFRSLFHGREDVYAVLWVNERTGKKGYAPACKDPWSLRKGQPREYLPLTDQVVLDHLSGKQTIGIFALLKENACRFLACDFDKEGWALDALSFLDACGHYGIPAYLERSRSGNGGHVWIFFSSPVLAVQARQLGMRLLRLTMDARAELDLGSYDRFFPNQDFMPKGGFGNLIAAPLQKKCRVLGNTEFLDTSTSSLKPWPDQWALLSQVRKLSPAQLEGLLEALPAVSVGPSESSKVTAEIRARQPAPKDIRCELGASLSVEKSGLPPWMLAQFKHLASLHNPEFHLNEKLRFSNHRTPRFIKCYREDFSHIHLPRGTLEEARTIARAAGSELACADRRTAPEETSFSFLGTLSAEQEAAVSATLTHDIGLLVAPPGAGKTVMGCAAIARRGLPTLILAHRKPILEQWRKQIGTLLGMPSRQVGQIGGGRDRQTGIVDLGMIQSLARIENLPSFFSRYGQIIVDECHNLPAATFEACLREASVRHVLGLTATPYRRDGLQDIIAMQCGPLRYRMTESRSHLNLGLHVRPTAFSLPPNEELPIQGVFRMLVENETRNALIERDILAALQRGRRCLVLSHWKEHCALLIDRLLKAGLTPHMLSGGLGKKNRTAILKAIQDTPPDKDLVVVATGQYLGEGFDCPQLNTLFLAFPVAFRGKLVQYAGRIMRESPGKSNAEIYDYLDSEVPVLNRMHARRRKAFQALGFELSATGH